MLPVPAAKTRFFRHACHFAAAIAIFTLLFCFFDFNALEIARPAWFDSYFTDAESVIIGRLAASRHEGLTSHGAMLGHYSEINDPVAPEIPVQIKAYTDGAPPSEWMPYQPQIGLHGMAWSLIDRFFPANAGNFEIFRAIASAFTAAVLTGIILWIGAEIGIAALIGVVIGLFDSPWVIVGGRNIYLVFGTYFLPLLVSCWAFRNLRQNDRAQLAKIMFALFVCFAVRFSCGYEYLTTISMAVWVPVVFYACRDRWAMKKFLRITALLAGVSVAAFVSVFAVHMLLLSTQVGGMTEAFKSILSHAEVRLGTPLLNSGQFIDQSLIENRESLTVGLWPVIDIYLRGFIDGPLISTRAIDWPLTFADLIFVGVLASLFVLIKAMLAKKISQRTRKQIALVAALGASFLAAMSWHVIAKQHSYIHHHLNFMLWYIPFVLILYALLGEIAGSILFLDQRPVSVPDVADVPVPEFVVTGPKRAVRKKRSSLGRPRAKRPVSRPS